MTSTSSSLVLGCVTWLPPQLVEPFIRSLRATSYEGRIGLVLGHYGEDELRVLSEMADFAVTVDLQYASTPSPRIVSALRTIRNTRRVRRAYPAAFATAVAAGTGRGRVSRWRALEYRLEGLQALRYGHYRDVMRGPGCDADQVLLTDVRDVLFQGDPFKPAMEGLEVFLEDASLTIGGEQRNREWINGLYGSSEVAMIGREVASCSGTVAGRRDDILRYLGAMTREVDRHRRPLGSHDQGVHNHLLWRGQLDPVTIVRNGHGRVLTMGGVNRVLRDDEGRVLNYDGTVPPILHQYDRHPSIAAELLTKLGLPA
jgi:hypothetical protein